MMSKEELPKLPGQWEWYTTNDVHWHAASEYPYTYVVVTGEGVDIIRHEQRIDQKPVPLSVIIAVAKANGVSL